MKKKFCPYCGTKLDEGARFCKNCGEEVSGDTQVAQRVSKERSYTENPTERKTVYDGYIHRCPNCGEVLNAFEVNCPACGYELRDTKASSAVREFERKLEAIESKREYKKPRRLFAAAGSNKKVSEIIDEQKISLIRNFSVPNTKEDILEFMILATSNIDTSVYSFLEEPATRVKAMTEAWNAKIKQVYAKAKTTYKSDPDFSKIQELYDSCYAEIRKQKKKKVLKWVLLIVLLIGWIPASLIPAILLSPKEEAKEIDRLEAIVVEVQDALGKKEYKLALNNADSIDYQRHDVEMERKWDIQRKYWVDKVLEEAAKNGIDLEYTSTPDIDKANDKPNDTESNGGFAEGFKEGIQPGLDAAKENTDEFNRIMNGE